MTNLSKNASLCLAALQGATENYEHCQADNSIWGTVYLSNADHPAELSVRQIAGYLGSLTKKGFYQDRGDCFGAVRLTGEKEARIRAEWFAFSSLKV